MHLLFWDLDEVVLEKLVPGNPLLLFHRKHLSNEVFHSFASLWHIGENEGLAQDVIVECVLAVGCPWSVAVEHFIESHAEGPNVTLGREELLAQYLGAHVQRCA